LAGFGLVRPNGCQVLDRFGAKLGTWACGLTSLAKSPHGLRVVFGLRGPALIGLVFSARLGLGIMGLGSWAFSTTDSGLMGFFLGRLHLRIHAWDF
jgi:hypothetical protein